MDDKHLDQYWHPDTDWGIEEDVDEGPIPADAPCSEHIHQARSGATNSDTDY